MQDRGVEDKVVTATFHAWCFRMLRECGLPAPNRHHFDNSGAWYAANVRAVLDAAERGLIPGGQVKTGSLHRILMRIAYQTGPTISRSRLFLLRPWMCLVINLGQVLKIQMGIDLRRRQAGMAEHFLHGPQIAG